jgi:hypothetical protein
LCVNQGFIADNRIHPSYFKKKENYCRDLKIFQDNGKSCLSNHSEFIEPLYKTAAIVQLLVGEPGAVVTLAQATTSGNCHCGILPEESNGYTLSFFNFQSLSVFVHQNHVSCNAFWDM